jgi:predicted dehydrogenase
MLKIGVIGAGQIAYNHCGEIQSYPDAKVVAVADVSEERRTRLQRACGAEMSFSDAKELARTKGIDAVTVALPNKLHADVSLAALESGKHVLLEKPMAMNLQEAQAVSEAAHRNNRILMLGMNQRFTRQSQTIKALVERGEMGEIYHAKAFWYRRTGTPKFGTWFCRKDMAGGGALLDIGVHLLDLCLHLMANFQPESVSGSVYTKFGNRGLGEGSWGMSDKDGTLFDVDDFATAFIKMQNGATVSLDVSWAIHQKEENFHNVQLFGADGGAGTFPPELYRSAQDGGEYHVVTPKNVPLKYPHCSRFHNWLDAILGKDQIEVTLDEALTVQKILDGIYASHESGHEVRFQEAPAAHSGNA